MITKYDFMGNPIEYSHLHFGSKEANEYWKLQEESNTEFVSIGKDEPDEEWEKLGGLEEEVRDTFRCTTKYEDEFPVILERKDLNHWELVTRKVRHYHNLYEMIKIEEKNNG